MSQAKPAVNARRMQAWLPQAGTRSGGRRRCLEAVRRAACSRAVVQCAVYLEYVVRSDEQPPCGEHNAAKSQPAKPPRGLPNPA